MQKYHTLWIALLTAALAGSVPLSAAIRPDGQTGTGASGSLPLFGKVDLSYTKSGVANTTTGYAQVSGHVRMTSRDYDLSCETLTFLSEKDKAGGRPVLTKVMAEPMPGAQIIADVRRPATLAADAPPPDPLHPAEGQTFHVVADHAAYVPDYSRPGGVKIDFTGHVKLIAQSGFLDGPSVTTTDSATILLGKGDDYPQVLTGPAHITATPMQQ